MSGGSALRGQCPGNGRCKEGRARNPDNYPASTLAVDGPVRIGCIPQSKSRVLDTYDALYPK